MIGFPLNWQRLAFVGLICLYPMLNGHAQELSRNIPVIIGNTDAAVQAIGKNDTVFLLTITFCHPIPINGDCMGIMAIDRLGNPIWNQIIDSNPYL